MSTVKVHYCDRCKNTLARLEYELTLDKVYQNNWVNTHFDLCENCINLFYSFMERKIG